MKKLFFFVIILCFFVINTFIYCQEKTTTNLGKITIISGEDEKKESVEDKNIREELKKLIPKDNDIKGWIIKTQTRYFNPENLWEYINGAAEHYIHYGFKQIAATEFRKKDNENITLTLDIYDMGNLKQAFGAYSTERPPDGIFGNTGVQSFSDELSTVFFKDKYLVKVFVFDISDETSTSMKLFAETTAKNIPGEASFPEELNLLPSEKKIKNSEKFIIEGILGESTLKNGFIARYNFKDGEPETSLFVLKTESKKESADVYAKIKEIQEKRENPMREIKGYGDNCLDVLTKYNGRIVIITKDNKIAGGWFLPKDDLTSVNLINDMLK